jgi:hypothetical protein
VVVVRGAVRAEDSGVVRANTARSQTFRPPRGIRYRSLSELVVPAVPALEAPQIPRTAGTAATPLSTRPLSSPTVGKGPPKPRAQDHRARAVLAVLVRSATTADRVVLVATPKVGAAAPVAPVASVALEEMVRDLDSRATGPAVVVVTAAVGTASQAAPVLAAMEAPLRTPQPAVPGELLAV